MWAPGESGQCLVKVKMILRAHPVPSLPEAKEMLLISSPQGEGGWAATLGPPFHIQDGVCIPRVPTSKH